MKKIIMLILLFLSITTAFSQRTVTCGTCKGYKALRCNGCNGTGVVYSKIWNPYYGCYQTIQQYCGYCAGRGSFVCNRCGGYGYLVVNSGQPSFGGNNLVAVTVSTRKCSGHGGSLCSCTTYKGYRIKGTNIYKGNCSNYSGGHQCGHGPAAHGL